MEGSKSLCTTLVDQSIALCCFCPQTDFTASVMSLWYGQLRSEEFLGWGPAVPVQSSSALIQLLSDYALPDTEGLCRDAERSLYAPVPEGLYHLVQVQILRESFHCLALDFPDQGASSPAPEHDNVCEHFATAVLATVNLLRLKGAALHLPECWGRHTWLHTLLV